MHVTVDRNYFTNNSSEGDLLIDDKFECYSLEDKDRNLESGGIKVAGKTAIPRGIYELDITYSNRFGQDMPIILNVPGFSGVRIHWGNTHLDVEGCIAIGSTNARLGDDFIGNSRMAYKKFFSKLKQAKKSKEKLTIEVK